MVNKNQTKQGTQKIGLFIKSTYDAICLKMLLKMHVALELLKIKGGNTTRSRRHSARDDPQSHGQLPLTASRVFHQ